MPLRVRAIDVGGPDLARVVVVSRRAEPDAAWGEDDFRRAAGHEPRHLVLLATDDGEDAGAAELAAIEAWDESLAMWLSLWVVPGRHGDAGVLLWEAIRGHCAAHGLTGLRAAVSSDRVELLELLLAKGFREVERDQRVRPRADRVSFSHWNEAPCWYSSREAS